MFGMWKRRRLTFVTFLGACLILLVGYISQPVKDVSVEGMISVAHRGAASYAPENTYAAFQKGIELGADFIEADVHLSRDGELIIMHDESVDRTTNGSGLIKNMTLEELKTLEAGSHFHPDYHGEPVITLNELMESFYGQVGLLIEVKHPALYPGIEEKVVEVLSQYPATESVIVQSFDIDAMKRIHELDPDLQIAVLMKASFVPVSLWQLDDLTSFATYINFNISSVAKRTVDEIHARGGKVLVWSKKDKRLIQKAVSYGVDGIITDFSRWPVEEEVQTVTE
ncbi:glycerophosphodiester phosphodiesterase [Jeotgalibacillus malaysiensis]|uniref:Glycerophosphodiester phosphodiesterase n=1 Tax=Jeotgalibacillus malaysiensis TaxID=1508404 RepID=A0A0B5AR75_9BACL|nr:glycerophosphodiester phosphodiesterase family protein [Jeotgalibacillus malaysiensis]AJD92740.1 glycerophosphodiester phosphodiesterase [Jeotgalibacillus malaysiensis]